MTTSAIVDSFLLFPKDAALQRRFLDAHPSGWCSSLRTAREVLGREAKKLDSRFSVCSCFGEPLFLKGVKWRPEFDEVWENLPESFEQDRVLHEEPTLLSPLFHIKTHGDGEGPSEWIRVFPYWASDLATLLSLSGKAPLPFPHACKIIDTVISGLCVLESCDFVHRDLKPSNILISPHAPGLSAQAFARNPSFSAILSDFSDQQTTGTRYWAAPEIMAGGGDSYSPIFAFGLLLWELLSRKTFKKFYRAYLSRSVPNWPRWPESLREYLEGSAERVSTFEQDVRSCSSRHRRIDCDPLIFDELVSLIAATVRYDSAERRDALASLMEKDGLIPADRPAAAIRMWLYLRVDLAAVYELDAGKRHG